MVFAEYYVNICEPFGCGGHIYYFQTNCRGGPRLIYYLKRPGFLFEGLCDQQDSYKWPKATRKTVKQKSVR